MRKKLLMFSLAGVLCGSISARTLTPAEALARALDSNSSTATHRAPVRKSPIMTIGEQASPAIYVFDQGQEGYMIVSADDVAAPVLGYSTTGTFDPDNMPDNMRWWLNQYKTEIEAAAQNGTPSYASINRANRAPIAPLLKTRWDQNAPYYNNCPMLVGDYTATGCVATAMAQVMKYHEWPKSFNADFSYEWKTGGQILTWKEDNVTFDWANMLNTYPDGSYTAAQANAVAKLMKACGYSVNMNYDLAKRGGSGAVSLYVSTALVNDFGYDKGARAKFRSFYGLEEWENIIYNNLKTCGPVIYSGANGDGAGHCFVCDGYQADGYFHFNWGWSGMSDGYFLLTALDPESQGIGGSTAGYNLGQEIIVGIRKPASTTDTSYIVCEGQFNATVTDNTTVKFTGPFYNFAAVDFIGQIGARIMEDDTILGDVLLPLDTIPAYSGYSGFSAKFSLKAGEYRVYPIYTPYKGETVIMTTPADHPGYVILRSNGTAITAEVPEVGTYTVTDLKMETPLYIGREFMVSGNAVWTGPISVSQPIFGVLMTGTTAATAIAIGQEMSMEFSADGEPSHFEYLSSWDQTAQTLTAGTYYFAMAMEDSNSIYGIRLLNTPIEVTLGANPGNPDIGVLNWSIENATAVVPDDINVTMRLTCTTGYFFNAVPIYVLGPIKPNVTSYYPHIFYTDRISLTSGKIETIKTKIQLPNALPGESYQAYPVNPYTGVKIVPRGINFTIGNQTGISDITADSARSVCASPNPAHDYTVISAGAEITRIDIASISGSYVAVPVEIEGSSARVDVSALAPGLYVARVATSAGVESVKIIKK